MSSNLVTQIDAERFKNIRCIATDMDGTLTTQGKFTSELIHTLEALAQAGIDVVIVTGRSAGWVSGLVHYLPIAGAIAENGGIYFAKTSEAWLVSISEMTAHRQQLAHMFQALQQHFPQLQESSDNRYRLTDWTFDVQGLTPRELEQIRQQCQTNGWSITYSTVQVHIKLPHQNKASGLLTVLERFFPAVTADHLVTVGDSPNDASLFDPEKFPFSVGVANVQDYRDQLAHFPSYITTAAEGVGFCELCDRILAIAPGRSAPSRLE